MIVIVFGVHFSLKSYCSKFQIELFCELDRHCLEMNEIGGECESVGVDFILPTVFAFVIF